MHIKINLPKPKILPDFAQFIRVVRWYLAKKATVFGHHFEFIKDFFVDKLMWQRGRLSRPFLTSTFFTLVGIGIVIAPIVKSRYPTLGNEEKEFTNTASQFVLTTNSASASQTTTKESIKPRDKIITYKVQTGENLTGIAQKFFGRKDNLAIKTIVWENDLNENDNLTVGQELKIIPVPGIAYRIQSGDTIYSIAKKFNADDNKAGASAQKIVDFPFNNFLNDETFALAVSSGDNDYIIVPDGVKPAPIPPKIIPQYFAYVPQVAQPLVSGLFNWPISGILSQYYSWWHQALDVAQSLGTPVVAAAGGRVIVAEMSYVGYGNYVIIDHGNGFQTLYAHFGDFAVSAGQSVSAGQTVGYIGLTGRTTGSHLHFEIRQNGVYVDPLAYLPH